MDRYKSHKIVEAFQIKDIMESGSGIATLFGDDTDVTVTHAYMDKHQPKVGGYYVRYPDGYESWSPAEAFEEGYTKEP